jgi:hypothetical protein
MTQTGSNAGGGMVDGWCLIGGPAPSLALTMALSLRLIRACWHHKRSLTSDVQHCTHCFVVIKMHSMGSCARTFCWVGIVKWQSTAVLNVCGLS